MRDLDTLTPLDARNSLLMDPVEYKRAPVPTPFATRGGYESVPLSEQNTAYNGARDDQGLLLNDAASFGGRDLSHTRSISGDRSHSPPNARAPRLPEVDLSAPGTGYGYDGAYSNQDDYRGRRF